MQHVGGQPGGGGVRGDRVGEVAGGGAGDRVEAELLSARASATETTRSLNECVGFAVSFLIHSSRDARGARRGGRPARAASSPSGSARARRALQRQEVRVAPERVRAGLDAALELVGESPSGGV